MHGVNKPEGKILIDAVDREQLLNRYSVQGFCIRIADRGEVFDDLLVQALNGAQFLQQGRGGLPEQADEGAAEDEIVEVEDALVAGDELDLAAGVGGERGERRVYT